METLTATSPVFCKIGVALTNGDYTEVRSLLEGVPDYSVPPKLAKRIAKELPECEPLIRTKATATQRTDYISNVAICDMALAEFYLYKVKSSKERGISWDLSLADVKRLASRKRCEYTGVAFTTDNPLTLERINNKTGYTKDNTVAVCRNANALKSMMLECDRAFTLKQIERMVSKLKQLGGKHYE